MNLARSSGDKMPKLVRILTDRFPGTTSRILSLGKLGWEQILGMKTRYVRNAACRNKIVFVDRKVMDECCPPRYRLAAEGVERIKEKVYEVVYQGRNAFGGVNLMKRFEQELKEDPPFWDIELPRVSCYLPEVAEHFSDYGDDLSGPAILICPERLEVRVRKLAESSVDSPLRTALKTVIAHEVTHSYIDAWSTPHSISKKKLSEDPEIDKFYHLILEESIATAVELNEIETVWRKNELFYYAFLLGSGEAENAGGVYLKENVGWASSTEMLSELDVGLLASIYTSMFEPPPLWTISSDVAPLLGIPPGIFGHLKQLVLGAINPIDKMEVYDVLERIFLKVQRSEDLWKALALSCITTTPFQYS